MPTLWMLIGVPGSGKSTWVKTSGKTGTVISTDDKIEAYAASKGLTYDDVFKSEIKHATSVMDLELKGAVQRGENIIWDQTNTTRKSRAAKMSKVPQSYRKVAVFFSTPDKEELSRRLKSRAGKTIPWNIVYSMVSMLEEPTPDEGWDEIIRI